MSLPSVVAKWAPTVARTLFGLVFVVFGLNYFIPFLPPQPAPPEAALPFLGGLAASGYVFPVIKVIEIGAGLALLSNRFVPLALTLLAPILVNIAAFHFVLAPSYGMPLALLALELYLAWTYRAAFAPLLRARTPIGAAAPAIVGARDGASLTATRAAT
jgi:hypothetical protein